MDTEEIIEMAKKSGAMFDHMTWVERDLFPVFERFAKLVAEHESKRLTDVAMKAAEKAVDVAMAIEREACAKIAEEPWQGSPKAIAELIRTRGQNNG